MRYFVEISGSTVELHVSTDANGNPRVRVADQELSASIVSVGPSQWLVRIGDAVLDLVTEGTAPSLGMVARGVQRSTRVDDERSRGANHSAGGSAGTKEREVRSPMPGRVVKVLVSVGDEVQPGQAVAIVEAMKMENEVRAKKGGRVSKIPVAPGATVEGNAVLVAFAIEE